MEMTITKAMCLSTFELSSSRVVQIFIMVWPICYIHNLFTILAEMENLTTQMCWLLVKKEGYLAIWQKPLNNSCYTTRNSSLAQPPLCDVNDNPDDVWYHAISFVYSLVYFVSVSYFKLFMK
jgi:Putative S-adenosyl-L-methionine-dependent methyltransferase